MAFTDKYDWHGCEFVEFNPEKLGGRAAVRNSRALADGILVNYESGMTVADLQENFELEQASIEGILAFAARMQLPAIA